MAHAEVRGRGKAWRVWTRSEAQMAFGVPLYDQEGSLKEMLVVAPIGLGDQPKMVECYGGPFQSADEAVAYAEYLGYSDVRVHKTKTKQESLAAARKAKRADR